MNGKAFLDTNILIYAYDYRDPRKQKVAAELIRTLALAGRAVISYQVVQEFFNFALQKAAKKMTHGDAQAFLSVILKPMLAVHSSAELVSEAIQIQGRYRI